MDLLGMRLPHLWADGSAWPAALLLLAAGMLIGSLARRRWPGRGTRAATDGAVRRLALLEAVIDSCGDAIFAKDRAGRYLLFNHAAERVTGKTRAEVMGRDDRALFPAHQAEMLMSLGRRVMDEDRALTDEEFLSAVDGERVFLATKLPLRDRDGAVVGLIGISRDVTDSRRSESALQAERELLAEMSAIAHLGGWSFDPVTGAGAWTAEVARIHDLDPGVVPNAPMGLDFFRGESRVRIETAVAAACGEGRPFDLELELVSATGRIKWVRSVGLAETGKGRIQRVRGFMQDISEQKRLASELERHRDSLEELVRERTEQLHEACERAEAASSAKSRFLANMSHEMRTPLHAIAGLATLLRRTPLDGRQLGSLDKLENAARHLLGLVSDVLDLSKIEAGHMALDCEDFELGRLLEQVRDGVAAEAAAKGLALQVECAGEPLWLRGDALRLRQALLNYASNAVKFTQRGSVHVRASHERDATGGMALHFDVVDTGMGIAAEHQPRLFERFEQGDMSTTRRFGGSGLGLAITRQLTEMMGGCCGVESKLGEGSRFWLELTLPAAAQGSLDDTAAIESVLEDAVRRHHAGSRVLLVEDNPVNREVATSLLAAVGIEVIAAGDGLDAIGLIGSDPPALVLMDLQMPRMDGPTAARCIRGMATGRHVPILAMTANVTDDTRRACDAAGMNGFIGKPFAAATLYEALLQWLPARAVPPSQPSTARASQALLQLFRRTHAGDAPRIGSLLAASDWDGLSQIAHALRGSSGCIGAHALQQASGAVEAALRRNTATGAMRRALTLDLRSELQACLATMADEPEQATPMSSTCARSAAMPPADGTGVIDRLESLLAAGDIDSAAWTTQNVNALHSLLGADSTALLDHVSSFRFDEALMLLRQRVAA